MSASTISLLIKDLQRIVIEGNINPHTLLAKELKQLNTSNFTQENKDLKEDILNYLADIKQRVEVYSRYKLEDYFRFTDYGSGFIDFIKPKLVSLYSKVSASTGEYSNSLTRATIVHVSDNTSIINNKLKTLKAEAIKLEAAKANKQQNTTPTVVANTSVKDLEDWINQWYEAQLKFETFSGTLSNYKSQDQKEIAQQLYDIFASDNFDTNLAKIIKTTELKNNIPLITTNINQYNLFFNLLKDNKVLLTTNNGITNDLYDHDYNYIIKQKELLINISNYYKEESKDKKSDILLPSSIDKSIFTTELPTTTAPKDNKKVELNPEQWGIKFTTTRKASSEDIRFLATADKGTVNDNFYMDLLPARQSTIPVQGGRDVPNALPGLNYKLIPQVGKQQIPGFSPVYQNLGIKGMQVTIVGAFTGGDGSVSNRKTDTPEPNSKTPFWSNAKGSPTLSDNPGRGSKLPELTAYNSSAEFKQVVYQGKQIEVEINLFQVYKQSTASQIGQDIKLQSKNGNPKFTGIVRSLVEDHATKERTWYTLVMDVTDFGMASKKPINLNNKLEEAIRNAQQEQETAKAAKVKSNAEQEASTIPNDPESTEVIINIKQRILALKDNNQKKKQLAIYDHLLEHIKTLKNKDNYALKKYNGGQPWGTFISNIGTYSDSSFFPISNSQLLFRLRLDCRTLLGIQGTCDSELYWLLDGAEGNTKPITKFIGNGTRQSTFLMLPAEKRERIANDPFGFGPYPEEDGSESQRNSLLSQAKNLSNAERGALTIKAIGCVAIGALGTVASVGTAGLATPGAIATTLGACAVFTSAEAYEKYDTLNKNEAQWSNAVWGDLAMDLFFTLGTVGLVRGGSAIVSKVTKQGNTVASNQISSFISTLVNKAKANIGNTIKYGNQTAIIDAVDGIPSINGKPAVRLKVGTETRTVPIENIANELDNIVPSTVTTTTNSTSANPSTVTSSGTANISRLTKEIDALSISDEIKRYIKSLDPENQRKVLTVINTQKANSTKSFTISRQGQSDLLVNPGDDVRLSSSGFVVRKGSVVYDIPYVEVTGSKVLRASSVSNTTNQTTPPPSQSPIPQQQTTSQTTQTQQFSTGSNVQGNVPVSTRLSGQALNTFNQLKSFVGKQSKKGYLITLNNGSKIIVKVIYGDSQLRNNIGAISIGILSVSGGLIIGAANSLFKVVPLETIKSVEEIK